MHVSAENFPNVYKAFLETDYDNGCINRYNPKKDAYVIPDAVANQLPVVEQQLASLSPEDFETFITGELEEVEIIRDRGLVEADHFLNLFFEDWETEE